MQWCRCFIQQLNSLVSDSGVSKASISLSNTHTHTHVALQELSAGLKKALSGDLEQLMLELLMSPVEHDANRLQQSMVVSGCHDNHLSKIPVSEFCRNGVCVFGRV